LAEASRPRIHLENRLQAPRTGKLLLLEAVGLQQGLLRVLQYDKRRADEPARGPRAGRADSGHVRSRRSETAAKRHGLVGVGTGPDCILRCTHAPLNTLGARPPLDTSQFVKSLSSKGINQFGESTLNYGPVQERDDTRTLS